MVKKIFLKHERGFIHCYYLHQKSGLLGVLGPLSLR